MKFFNKKNKLFPAIEPFDSGYITKGIHEIYYEQCGNPKGKPLIFLHGENGGGSGSFSNDSLILKSIVLFSLINEVVARANRTLV